MDSKMNIDKFIEAEIETLKEFKQSWAAGVAAAPEDYPTELEPGEWDEQFRAFLVGVV